MTRERLVVPRPLRLTTGSTTNDLHRFDLLSMEWSELSVEGDPPPARVYMGFVEVHGSLLVLAGTTDLSESPLAPIHPSQILGSEYELATFVGSESRLNP
jgi:hypothetical protein